MPLTFGFIGTPDGGNADVGQRLQYGAGYIGTVPAGEKIVSIGYYVIGPTQTNTVTITVYDITDGIDGVAVPVGSLDFANNEGTANELITKRFPVAIGEEGRTYALSAKSSTETGGINTFGYTENNVYRSTAAYNDPAPSPWVGTADPFYGITAHANTAVPFFGSDTPDYEGNYEVYGPTGTRNEIIGATGAQYRMSVPSGGITITSLKRGLIDNAGTGSVLMGVYNYATNELIGSADINLSPAGAGSYIWLTADNLSIEVPDTVSEIFLATAQPDADAWGTSLAVTLGDTQTSGTGTTLPATWAGTDFDYLPPMQAEYTLGASSPVGATLTVNEVSVSPAGQVTWTSSLTGIQRAYLTDSQGNNYEMINVTDTSGSLVGLSHGLSACLFENNVTVTVSTIPL